MHRNYLMNFNFQRAASNQSVYRAEVFTKCYKTLQSVLQNCLVLLYKKIVSHVLFL